MGAKLDKGILYFEIACQNYTFTPLSTQWPPCLCLWVRQFAPTPPPPATSLRDRNRPEMLLCDLPYGLHFCQNFLSQNIRLLCDP